MPASVITIYRYPVKGLSPEVLPHVALTAGEPIPFDRAYAIENGPGRFDELSPKHLPKTAFLMLMRDEKLATLETSFDPASHVLTIRRAGKQVARGQLSTPTGRQLVEQFVGAYMKPALRGAPRIVSAPGHMFSDVDRRCVHIVNLASVREVERIAGRPVSPVRFRPNIVVDGLPPWAELGLVGQQIRIGDVAFKVFARTTRCAATDVDPNTGVRDMSVPSLLQRTWGHTDFGIYAIVESAGTIKAGDEVVTSKT